MLCALIVYVICHSYSLHASKFICFVPGSVQRPCSIALMPRPFFFQISTVSAQSEAWHKGSSTIHDHKLSSGFWR